MLLTIGSAGRVLELFTDEVPDRGVTEVAGILGMSKSKSHALLASLAEVGLLRSVDGGRYRLGWRLLSLGRVLSETTDFRVHARPVMEALTAHFGELVHLGTLSGSHVIYVDRVAGRSAVGVPVSKIGATLPAHGTGVGKTLLAGVDAAELDELIGTGPLDRLTPLTTTDPVALRGELREIRRRGYAIDRGEAVVGVSCAAAPVVARGPRVVAALSLTVPTERFEAREALYREAVIRAAAHISKAMRREADARSEVLNTRMPVARPPAGPRASRSSAARDYLEVA